MIIRHVCPECRTLWNTVECHGRWAEKPGMEELAICCPACHAERKKKLAEREAMYPSAESLGLLGSITEIPTERFVRPHQRGKQVNHKSEHRAG